MAKVSRFTCRAILFDMDGTLIDSTARIQRLWEWWAARRGVPLEALVGVMHGRAAVDTIRLAAPGLQPEQEIEALEAEEIADMHDIHLIPGALELLARLAGAPWAIVTSGSARVAEARINHVRLPRPPLLITSDLVPKAKPAPDGYLLAAERLGVPARDCIVIEDSPVGVAAGVAAGMRVIAVAYSHPRQALQAADGIVASIVDLGLSVDQAAITVQLLR